MHIIDCNNLSLRTDLLIDNKVKNNKILEKNGVELYRTTKDNLNYSTISFIDTTDKDQAKIIGEILTEELKNYIKVRKSKVLIIGLGNRFSTADAIGPKTLDQILVTRHLFNIGDIEQGYSNVAIFEPSVYGTTGIDSVEIIKEVVKLINPDYCIIIDSLCTSSTNRMNRTIQITDAGINPGSGVFNDRGELSNKTLNTKVIAIGVPTVVDIVSLIVEVLNKHNVHNIDINENLIVTPKEIDFLVEKLSFIIGNSLNKVLHEAFISTK